LILKKGAAIPDIIFTGFMIIAPVDLK
jgi:hypothetical protein